MVDLSVVMPAYNEAENLPAALADLSRHVFDRVPAAEVIVVDDGSVDETADVLAALAGREPRITVIAQANAGHGAAVMAGLARARGGAILLLDSDGEVSLDGFAGHWDLLERSGTDAVLGVRRNRQSPWHRVIVTAGMRVLIRRLFGVHLLDANAPYKLVSRAAWERARPLIRPECQIPSAALAVALMHTGGNAVHEVDVTHIPRRAGTTTLRIGRLSRLCAAATADLLNLRRMLRG